VLSSYTYTYDNAGSKLSVTENDGSAVSYGYDDIYQLTSETRTGTNAYSITYQYDAVGNRMKMVKDSVTTNYTHNANNQLLTEKSPDANIVYAYDDNGNLTNDGFYKFYYDCENRLTDVNYVSNNHAASYKYDWLGRRVRKIDYTLNPERYTLYCYDGDQVIAEYTGGSQVSRAVRPLRIAYFVSSATVCISSLFIICRRWVSTVLALM